MSKPDPLDELLSMAAEGGREPLEPDHTPEQLKAYVEGRADSETTRRVEAGLSKSKSQRQLWRAMQDERRSARRPSAWWLLAPLAAGALFAFMARPAAAPSLHLGPLPPGLSAMRGASDHEIPKYGPEHHPELDLRSDSEQPPKVRLYAKSEQGTLRAVPFELKRRSAWVHTLKFSAQSASRGRAGPVALMLGPEAEDWQGLGADGLTGLAQFSFEFVPE